jgi:hypothetical protein
LLACKPVSQNLWGSNQIQNPSKEMTGIPHFPFQ